MNAFSQNGDHVKGGRFTKTIEYNLLWLEAGYNFNHKNDVEKLFFGDYNALIEFFYHHSFSGYSGFRIVRDSIKRSYVFEMKYVTNFEEAENTASAKYPLSSTALSPSEVLEHLQKQNSLTEEERKLQNKEKVERVQKNKEEKYKLYNIETFSISVTDEFAEKLYHKMVSVIDNFKAIGVPPHIFDGDEVTFRTIVDDELWTLKIHVPTGNARKMSNICIQIMDDVKNNTFEELKNIKSLDF
jgi:hypothetical protein